jgi:AcrR family transcriptional regulator
MAGITATSSEAPAPTRERILSAARERFEKFGYRRTSVAEIAAEAGTAVGTLYRYFSDKEEIFLEVIKEGNAEWLAQLEAVLKEPGTPIQRLWRFTEASMEIRARDKLLDSILAKDTQIILAPLVNDLYGQLASQTVAMMAQVIRDGIKEGSFLPLDAEKLAYVLYIGGEGLYNQKRYHYREIVSIYATVMALGFVPR